MLLPPKNNDVFNNTLLEVSKMLQLVWKTP